MKILMVCLGNICRSPMAEGLLRHKSENTSIEVDSSGTSAYHVGENPDSRAVITLRKRGIDIGKLCGRQFSVVDFDAFDKIYVMDHSNRKNVLALARNEADREKVDLILNEIDHLPKDSEVPDPYYGGDHHFVQVVDLLDLATESIVKKYGA